jgi:hypothetical protein
MKIFMGNEIMSVIIINDDNDYMMMAIKDGKFMLH